MDILYESICRITQSLLREIVEASMARRGRIFSYIGALFFVLLAVLSFIFKEYWLGAALLAFCAIYFYWVRTLPQRTSRRVFEQYTRASKEDHIDIKVSFAELDITVETMSTGDIRRYEYDELCSIMETEHLYLLDMGKKTVIYVSKDGFTKGTAEGFCEFIQRRAGMERAEK